MGRSEFDHEWRRLSEEVITGMREWRIAHPKATFAQIEAALDERLNRMRARMLEDAARASASSEWAGKPEAERPTCPCCGSVLTSRGQQERSVQTQGGRQVRLKRSYGVCPTCGVGLFPPG
jgi:YgiT-type zinc finger domain-containing protein